MRLFRHAFTLVELLASIALLAALVAVSLPFIANYVSQARQTSERQTLEVLNDAINRYKTQGGSLAALTVGKPKNHLLEMLSTPVTWAGVSHQFFRESPNINLALTMSALGSGATYRVTQYGSYSAEAGGTEMNEQTPFDKTNLVAWYDFGDATDAHGSADMTPSGSPTYNSGYVSTTEVPAVYLSASLNSFTAGGDTTDKTWVIRFRVTGAFDTDYGYVFNDAFVSYLRATVADGIRCNVAGVTLLSGVPMAANTWYTVIAESNATTDVARLWINNTLTNTQTTTTPYGISIPIEFGAQETNAGAGTDFAFFACFNRLLTAEERTRLYNGGADINYSEL